MGRPTPRTLERNRWGGLARDAGLSESGIARFIDACTAYRQLDAEVLLGAMGVAGVRYLNFYGISRIDQAPRVGDLAPGIAVDSGRYHGWTRAWTVRVRVRRVNSVSGSFADGERGAEDSLLRAMAFRDQYTDRDRGPFTPKRPREVGGHTEQRQVT